MNLKSIKYCRFRNENNEWSIEGKPQNNKFGQVLTLDNVNLIVGKNASGKSRTVNAIRHIADLLSSEVKISQLKSLGYGTADYTLLFDDNGIEIEYHIDFKNGEIKQEVIKIAGKEKLNRLKGKLWYEGANTELDFQTDDNVLAVSKRDKKQHSFFEKLYSWGVNLTHYRFGEKLGKNALLRDIEAIKDEAQVNLKSGDQVAEIFIRGERKFGNEFINLIIEDMKQLSYNLSKIETATVKYFPIAAYGLIVQEKDLSDITDQTEMSQGMFRALSLLVQLNYSLLNKIPSCILIDDIGEGLDFERSKSLIDLIIKKVKKTTVQVIMTTNDRFIMNKIPLEYWSVIQRIPKKSLFYNYKNSKETFDEYKYSGLSNFDFLATEFYISGFENEEQL